MHLAIAVLTVTHSINYLCAFNFDPNFSDIISTDQENSYFGFSVLLQKGNPSVLITGAIKSNSIYDSHSNITKPGAVYRCVLDGSNACQQYLVDQEGNTFHNDTNPAFNFKHRKDEELLGFSLDGGENVGDSIVICAPKWINERRDISGEHNLANGLCYLIRNSTNIHESGETLIPLLYAGKQGYTVNGVSQYYYALGEAGICLHYLQSYSEILIGAPGVMSFRGTVIRYQLRMPKIPSQYHKLVSSGETRQTTYEIAIPNPLYIPSLKETNTYFGYSSSYGVFKNEELWYVAGAPRASELRGKVIIYSYPAYDDSYLLIHQELEGEQMGSYFGATVLALNVKEDLLADLLVGAPMFMTKRYDEGCVYYYKNDGRGSFQAPIKLFGDKNTGSHFGLAISNLGDVNHDSFTDLAISAPHEENGKGTVYIFLGSENGVNRKYSQRLNAEAFGYSMAGMGYSLSRGLDIDENSFNDLAIGAYKSSNVVVVKSKPIIKYHGTLSSSFRELPVNTHINNLDIQFCIKYNTTSERLQSVNTFIQIYPDIRVVNLEKYNETVELTRNLHYCKTFNLTLKVLADYVKPVTIVAVYTIANCSPSGFGNFCPVTNPDDGNSTSIEIPFANGCGEDNVCQTDLSVSANFERNINYLIIGSQDSLVLDVTTANSGEPAYLSQLRFEIPANLDMQRIPKKCELLSETNLCCLIKNVLQRNESETLTLQFDLRKLTSVDSELRFSMNAESRGNEVNKANNNLELILPLRTIANVKITGISDRDQIIYNDGENNIFLKSVNLTHEFAVVNLGPSPLSNLKIEIDVPAELNDLTLINIYEVQGALGSNKIDCRISTPLAEGFQSVRSRRDVEDGANQKKQYIPSENFLLNLPTNRTLFLNCSSDEFKCLKLCCKVQQEMKKSEVARIKISLELHIISLGDLLRNKDLILLASEAYVPINKSLEKGTARTLLIGTISKVEVSYWIYVCGMFVGLLILAAIVVLLYKLNFFSRPLREKLENLSEGSHSIVDDDTEEREQHMQ